MSRLVARESATYACGPHQKIARSHVKEIAHLDLSQICGPGQPSLAQASVPGIYGCSGPMPGSVAPTGTMNLCY